MGVLFKVWGIELADYRFPHIGQVEPDFWLDDVDWAPLDAPRTVPAGSTQRIDTMAAPFGCTRCCYRDF